MLACVLASMLVGAIVAEDSPLCPRTAPRGPFWANASHAGLPVACSASAKACLAAGRLLHTPTGRCFAPGDSQPCGARGVLAPDARALRQGRLHAACRSRDGDPSRGTVVMAFDGKAHSMGDVYDKLCAAGELTLLPHPFGGWECVARAAESSGEPPVVRQPAAEGRCLLPDLHRAGRDVCFRVRCTPSEAACLEGDGSGSFQLPYKGGCHPPLAAAPCPEGRWLTLDPRAAEAGRLRVVCSPMSPCGADAYLLRAAAGCVSSRDLRERLCSEEQVILLPTGEALCSAPGNSLSIIGRREGDGTCSVRVELVSIRFQVADLICVRDEKGNCQRVVIAPSSNPDFMSEDEDED